MMAAMTTATTKPRPVLRLSQRARIVPSAQFVRWYEIASATPKLSRLELLILAGLAEHRRRLHIDGYAGRLSIERMALDLSAVPRDVRAAVRNLIGMALIGVRPGEEPPSISSPSRRRGSLHRWRPRPPRTTRGRPFRRIP
jgi:hypothetical protein